MNIAVIGTGKVGLVVGAGFAENGHRVACVDKSEERIRALSEGTLPIYEPGLKELVARNLNEDRLLFTTDLPSALGDGLIVFICVDTPGGRGGEADLSQVFSAAEEIGGALTEYAVIVMKSACPVGTAERVEEIIKERAAGAFDVVVNPEFMTEGNAVDDFMRPDRVVIGCNDVRVIEIVKELYAPFLRSGKPFLIMDPRSAELSKYAASAILGARISLINEIANVAEAYGADINQVRQAVMADSRIGRDYLYPGVGFGGSCLPKDISALAELAKEKGLVSHVIEGALRTNRDQLESCASRILAELGGDPSGKAVAIWGASFKPKTDDLRNAPALAIIDRLLDARVSVKVYDPAAGDGLRAHYGGRIEVAAKMYEVLAGADALFIATEWREFHNPDFARMASAMRGSAIYDGRNLYEPKVMAKHGFRYASVGRPAV